MAGLGQVGRVVCQVGLGLVLAAGGVARAQTDPVFITPVDDARLTSPALTFEWQVDLATLTYVMRIEEIDAEGAVVPGTPACEFVFAQGDTTNLGSNRRRLVYNLESPPAFVGAEERADLATLGSGRFRVTLNALQLADDGEGVTTYTFGAPAPQIEMSTEDAKDPRDLRWRLRADDPDNTPEYRYTLTFAPQGSGEPVPLVMESAAEAVDQAGLGIANTATALGLMEGTTYDLQLLVEDTLNQSAAAGQGASGTAEGMVRINDLARITARPDDFIFHYPHGDVWAATVPAAGVMATDLDSAAVDIEAVIDYPGGDDPGAQFFPARAVDTSHTLELDLTAHDPAQPHPMYGVQLRATDALEVTGELSEPFSVTLNQRPAVLSAEVLPAKQIDYDGSTDTATVPVTLRVTVDDFETETLDVRVAIHDPADDTLRDTQTLEDVPRNVATEREILLPKSPPAEDYAEYLLRITALDETEAGDIIESAASDVAEIDHVRLNEIPHAVEAPTAPAVVSYDGTPALVQVPLTVHAGDKEPGPLTVYVDARSTDGELLETINVGAIEQDVESVVNLEIAPRAPRRIYDLEIYFRDEAGADSFRTTRSVRLNQPPGLAAQHAPAAAERQDLAADAETIPFDVELTDDWSTSLTIQFEGLGALQSFDFERDFIAQVERVEGTLAFDAFGAHAVTETIRDGDGATAVRDLTPLVINDLPMLLLSVTPAIFDAQTGTWRVEQSRPTTFAAQGRNIHRDPDELLTLTRQLETSDEPGLKELASGNPPAAGIVHELHGSETRQFEELGEFSYDLTLTERFDGEEVEVTASFPIRVEESIPELNAAGDWRLYR